MTEPIRIAKRMAELGLCSRREAEAWIAKGWVRVDGQVVSAPATKVAPDQVIAVDPAARGEQASLRTFLMNKPVGYVSAQSEGKYPAAVTLLKPENRDPKDPTSWPFHPRQLHGLAPAGRLDIDSRGLLVLTQDGRVAKRLISPDGSPDKEYHVRVEGGITEDRLSRLRHGLSLEGRTLRPAGVEHLPQKGWLKFVLREGRKRQIRRMAEAVGLRVTALVRVRIGLVRLGDLPEGKWRFLGPDEAF